MAQTKRIEQGDIVMITGLRTKPEWNGKYAEISGEFVRKRHRWPIKFLNMYEDTPSKLLQPKNLLLEAKADTLRYFANKTFESLVQSFDNVHYVKDIQSYFGIEINKGPLVCLGQTGDEDEMDLTMPLGNVMFCTWSEIYSEQRMDRNEVVNALCDATLPQWFEDKVRNGANANCHYSKALCDSNLFEQIKWGGFKTEISTNLEKTVNVIRMRCIAGSGLHLDSMQFEMSKFRKYISDHNITRRIKSEFGELLGFDLSILDNPTLASSEKVQNAGTRILTTSLSTGYSPHGPFGGDSFVFCENKPIAFADVYEILKFIMNAAKYYDATLQKTEEEMMTLYSDAEKYREGKWN